MFGPLLLFLRGMPLVRVYSTRSAVSQSSRSPGRSSHQVRKHKRLMTPATKMKTTTETMARTRPPTRQRLRRRHLRPRRSGSSWASSSSGAAARPCRRTPPSSSSYPRSRLPYVQSACRPLTAAHTRPQVFAAAAPADEGALALVTASLWAALDARRAHGAARRAPRHARARHAPRATARLGRAAPRAHVPCGRVAHGVPRARRCAGRWSPTDGRACSGARARCRAQRARARGCGRGAGRARAEAARRAAARARAGDKGRVGGAGEGRGARERCGKTGAGRGGGGRRACGGGAHPRRCAPGVRGRALWR
jgi:hypothetical protein